MKGRIHKIVVAFYPNARGFAYAVFEGQRSLIDWGVADVRRERRARYALRRLAFLADRYRPDAVVIRRMPEGSPQKYVGFDAVAGLARRRGADAVPISRAQITQAFAVVRAPTRYAIAQTIAQHIPILASLLPPARKIWNGEDRRMGLFDAAALALTFFGDFTDWEAAA